MTVKQAIEWVEMAAEHEKRDWCLSVESEQRVDREAAEICSMLSVLETVEIAPNGPVEFKVVEG